MNEASAGQGTAPHRALITGCVMLATVMQALDMTIANVALPNMQGSLSATQDQISWVLTSYIIAAAIMMPTTGFLAARFGRKRVFLVSVAGFTAASALCGIAGSLEEIVLFRLIQGAFGAPLVPLSQSIILDTFPREKHGSAMAIWGVGVMIGPILGPTLGGYLTEVYSWRWVFYINLPFGLLAFLGIMMVVPRTKRDRKRRLDIFGFALLTLAIGAFQIMLDRGEYKDWFGSTEIIIEASIAALAAYLFIVHSLTSDRPFIDLSLFGDRNFVVGLLFIFIFGGLLVTTMALMPPFLQNLVDFPVMTVGVVLAPRGLGAMIGMMFVSRTIEKVDPRLLMFVGLGMVAWSLYEMAGFTNQVGIDAIVWTGSIQGFGLGLFFVPLNTVAFSTVAPRSRTEAAGIFNLMRNVGSSMGISIMVSLLIRNTQINHSVIAEQVTPYNEMFRAPNVPALWDLAEPAGRIALNAEITRQAATIAYLNDFKALMFVALFSAPLLLLFRRQRRQPAAG
jgi:DHA2 family multidrug resistance protein